MQRYLIKNISIVNEGSITAGDVLLHGERIEKVAPSIQEKARHIEINGSGKFLLPGIIDDQVHFREPGLTHKGNIFSDSRAAIAGGVTSFMEMPNTQPPALTQQGLEEKYGLAKASSVANYSFFMGVSNDNSEEVLKTNEKKETVCGVKIFMGSSTGNMLVDNYLTLDKIFAGSELLIATHCENEKMIRENLASLQAERGDNLTVEDHPLIRNEEVCFSSSHTAIQFAQKHGSRLHILHISTARELQLFSNLIPLKEKRITAEVCVHHLYFHAGDYSRYGNLIKCNPAIKAYPHQEALWKGLLDNRLDVVASDHAPHTWEEKQRPYLQCPSGLPLVQHSLLIMAEGVRKGRISLEKMVEKMCHAPAEVFRIRNRGYIREGFFGDLVILDLEGTTQVEKNNIHYRCGWSPFEGHKFPGRITHTFVNGSLAYQEGQWTGEQKGQRLQFDR
ncbi:MAG: dihydroorotase [Chitinophagaceae bacterium]